MMIQNIWGMDSYSFHRQMRRAQTVIQYIDITPTDFVLDLGCAEGFITNQFLSAEYVIGLDRSRTSLLMAKQKVKKANADFVLSDVSALPFKETSFNKIVLLEVLEHLPKDTQTRLCSQLDSVLSDQGVLIISTPYKEKIGYTYCIHCGNFTPLWGHLWSLDEKNITAFLTSNFYCYERCTLPNFPMLTLSVLSQKLPFRVWFLLNRLLGCVRKGYWVVLKYQKKLSCQSSKKPLG